MPPASKTSRQQRLRTFAQASGSRPTEPESPRKGRSFNLPEELVARAGATTRGTQARAYGTELDGQVPDSLSRLVEEAVEAACTYYENTFNDGAPFPPADLSPGPGARGAREGAAKRAAAAKERAAQDTETGDGRPARRTRRAGATA